MLGVVTQGKQPGVKARVERFYAPVHNLREAGEVVDRADFKPGLTQRGRRTAG